MLRGPSCEQVGCCRLELPETAVNDGLGRWKDRAVWNEQFGAVAAVWIVQRQHEATGGWGIPQAGRKEQGVTQELIHILGLILSMGIKLTSKDGLGTSVGRCELGGS